MGPAHDAAVAHGPLIPAAPQGQLERRYRGARHIRPLSTPRQGRLELADDVKLSFDMDAAVFLVYGMATKIRR
jgi:hypothetical protein